tara:strand:- start:6786 stop:7994 length:1209 start_codon:yes stop_codon:yes gene_type:complete
MAEEVGTTKPLEINYIKYIALLVVIILIPIVLEFDLQGRKVFEKNTFFYLLCLVIPLLFIFGYEFIFQGKKIENKEMLMYFLIIAAIMAVFSYAYYQLAAYKEVFIVGYYVSIVLAVLGIIVGLAAAFAMFGNYFKSTSGVLSFITYFVFYIPCLLLDFVKYVVKELKITTKPIYILLIIELVIILLYFYLPKLFKTISKKEGIPLVDKNVFLNEELTYSIPREVLLDLNDDVKNKDNSNAKLSTTNRKNYSLSMWIYLNNYDPLVTEEEQEKNIIDFNNGLPKITFVNGNANKNVNVYFTNVGNNKSQSLKLQTQKWNNIVFNYQSTHVDLFVNGDLEQTFNFTNNLPNYTLVNNILKTGEDSNLQGAIANIRYYKKSQDNRKLVNYYNILKNKNPPTFNL